MSHISIDSLEETLPTDSELTVEELTEIFRVKFESETQTSSPRELADQTLQDLKVFLTMLENLSQKAAGQMGQVDFFGRFISLLDGISTFIEAITHIKAILRLGMFPAVSALEIDLLSILKDLLTAQEKRQSDYMIELLNLHLPSNLREWRETGIPKLIRARDS